MFPLALLALAAATGYQYSKAKQKQKNADAAIAQANANANKNNQTDLTKALPCLAHSLAELQAEYRRKAYIPKDLDLCHPDSSS